MNEKKNPAQSDWERVSELVDGLTEQQVRNALTEILSQNKNLENWMELKYSKDITDKYMDRIKENVDQCYAAFCQKIQIKGDNDMGDFLQGLKKILNEKVQLLIDKKNYLEAFEMSLYVMKIAGAAQGKDSRGSIYTLTNTCLAIWQNIVWDCSVDQKKLIHRWLKNSKNNGYDDYFFKEDMKGIVDEILASEFDDEDVLTEQLEAVDRNIQNILEQSGEEGLAYFKGFPHPILERITLMEKLKAPEGEIQDFKDQFMFVPDVRLIETKKVIMNKDFNKAIRMLAVSQEVDRGRLEWEKVYSDLLISIYAMANNLDAYRRELINNIKSFEQDTTYNVERLKATIDPEEWPEWLERILNVMAPSRGRLDVLFEEGKHRELIEEVQNNFGPWALERYVDDLAEEFPMEIIDYYIDQLHEECAVEGTRQSYIDMMKKLKRLEQMPGGQLIAEGLAAEWRERFPNRVEMMEELKNAGF